MCTGVKIVLDVSCGTTTTSTTTITAATTTTTNNVVMKSEMKYQSRVCFLTLFLAYVSVNAYCQSTELQIKVPLLSFSNKSTGRVSPAQKKKQKKTWQTVSIMSELQRKQFFFLRNSAPWQRSTVINTSVEHSGKAHFTSECRNFFSLY